MEHRYTDGVHNGRQEAGPMTDGYLPLASQATDSQAAYAVPGEGQFCNQTTQTTYTVISPEYIQRPSGLIPDSQAKPSSRRAAPVVARPATGEKTITHGNARRDSNNGRVSDRMGCCPTGHQCLRKVGPFHCRTAHQCIRDAGSKVRPATFQGLHQPLYRQCPGRQQIPSRLSEQRGRHEIISPVKSGYIHTAVVPGREYYNQDILRPGIRESPGGCLIAQQRPTGMATGAPSGQKDFQTDGPTSNRSVRIISHGTASMLHEPGSTGFTGDGSGFAGSGLELSPGLCIPTTKSSPNCAEQTGGLEVQTTPNSPMLVRHALATDCDTSLIRHPSPPAVEERSSDGGSDGVSSETDQQLTPDAMASFRQTAGLRQLPEDVQQVLESSWAVGTRRHYATAWRSWQQWCSQQNVGASSISVTKLLDYLHFLVIKGFAWRTVGLHRSALSSILQADHERPVGKHPLVSRFLKGVFKMRPPTRSLGYVWDLSAVLSLLKTWTPAGRLSLYKLTLKTLFLIALVTAKRIHDLTLLRVSPEHSQVGPHNIMLQPTTGSKTDRQGHLAPAARLTPFNRVKTLCPVTYLRQYIKATAQLRGNNDQLFISAFKPHKPVCKATLNRWVAAVLKDAGIQASPGSIRATSASHARAAGVSVARIMLSADWSRATTFNKYYSKLIPADSLNHLNANSVQNTILSYGTD